MWISATTNVNIVKGMSRTSRVSTLFHVSKTVMTSNLEYYESTTKKMIVFMIMKLSK